MANRKDLIIAVLVTFCLTATLFLVNTTKSQTTGQYDPWLDVDHDGIINMKERALAKHLFSFFYE